MIGRTCSTPYERSSTRKSQVAISFIHYCGKLTDDSVKLPKSFVAINLSEKVPHAFDDPNAQAQDRSGTDSQSVID